MTVQVLQCSAGITIKIQGKKNLSWINSGQIVILHGLTQLPVLTPLNLAPSACRSGLQPLFHVLGGDMSRYFAWGVTHFALLSKISSSKTSWVFITFRRDTSWTSSAMWLVLVQNKNVSKTHASLQRISYPGYNASPGTNPEWQPWMANLLFDVRAVQEAGVLSYALTLLSQPQTL